MNINNKWYLLIVVILLVIIVYVGDLSSRRKAIMEDLQRERVLVEKEVNNLKIQRDQEVQSRKELSKKDSLIRIELFKLKEATAKEVARLSTIIRTNKETYSKISNDSLYKELEQVFGGSN